MPALVFDCNFESGSLGQVTKVNDFEYELCLRPDTNNAKYRLWFYFSVKKARAKQRVLMHIVNFSKTKSLYREGMSPMVRSSTRPTWQRVPERNVFYYRCPKHKNNYVLSFLFEFDKEDDVYFFAYSFPYTYTDLQKYLYGLDQLNLPYYKRELLCRTVQHRRLDILTITSPNSKRKKKHVVMSARVHPGETPAQYVCQGVIDFLTGESPTARALRDHIVFVIIPMLNPDGVFLGNYRCSYMGFDLNRQWTDPDMWSQPEIRATKEMLLRLNNDPEIGE
jgi:murein tripeptide amidase MpaA